MRVGPSLRAELILTHETPSVVGLSAETSLPSFGRMLNFTDPGFSTRLRKLSNTKTTVLIPLALPTGTRDGLTSKLSLFGAAGLTKNVAELHPSDAQRTAM